MELLEAIRLRRSVRRYAVQPVEPEKLEALGREVERLNAQYDVGMKLVTNERHAFGNWLVHYGRFSGVRNYFVLAGPSGGDADERLGRAGEQLVLMAQSLGLSTCWVGATFGKRGVRRLLGDKEVLRCVIAMGYGTAPGRPRKSKTFEQVSCVPPGGDVPDWFRRGVEAALLAPTALNRQRFCFVLHSDLHVTLRVGTGCWSRVDAGIVCCHFELAAEHPVVVEP